LQERALMLRYKYTACLVWINFTFSRGKSSAHYKQAILNIYF